MSLSYLSLELFDKNLLDFRGRKKDISLRIFLKHFRFLRDWSTMRIRQYAGQGSALAVRRLGFLSPAKLCAQSDTLHLSGL